MISNVTASIIFHFSKNEDFYSGDSTGSLGWIQQLVSIMNIETIHWERKKDNARERRLHLTFPSSSPVPADWEKLLTPQISFTLVSEQKTYKVKDTEEEFQMWLFISFCFHLLTSPAYMMRWKNHLSTLFSLICHFLGRTIFCRAWEIGDS